MKEINNTKNYKQFKKLMGNRKVDENRINKIIKSIRKVGYITSPIIVNEKMEVIDGQGRLEALERLHMPVEYIVEPGIGINECISMNVHQTNWTLMDYIVSFASRGMESYIKILKLKQEYPEFTIHAIGTSLFGIGKLSGAQINKGDLEISDELYETAKSRLKYCRQFNDVIMKMSVNKECLRQTILFLTMIDEVDKDFFLEKFLREGQLLKPFHTIPECMQAIEELYNYGKQKRVYIYVLYDVLARNNLKRSQESMKKISKRKNEKETIKIECADDLKKALETLKQ